MYVVVILLTYFGVYVNTSESDKLFDFDADGLFKSIIGRDPNHIRETTHGEDTVTCNIVVVGIGDVGDDITDAYDDNVTGTPYRLRRLKPITVVRGKKTKTNEKENNKMILKTQNIIKTTTKSPVAGSIKEPSVFDEHSPPKTVEELKNKMREIEIERILTNHVNPIPNFERGDDDASIITRRFDKMLDDQDTYRRYYGKRWLQIKKRNIWRNRTIAMMEHFVYATRYKLPYSQMLRKKYKDSTRYRMGFCFGLLHQLKRQQLLMFTQLTLYQFKISTIHAHMRMYEKIVRLDIDIKDVMRLIRQLESNRRLKEDPNYYDEFVIERETTSLFRDEGTQEGEGGKPLGAGSSPLPGAPRTNAVP